MTRAAPSRHAGTLPATKFALPPEQPTVIVRSRLMDALDAGIRRPLALIAAPPGAGTTAMLGNYTTPGKCNDSFAAWQAKRLAPPPPTPPPTPARRKRRRS